MDAHAKPVAILSGRGVYRGPKCDKCGGRLRVSHTGPWMNGKRDRSYRCVDCPAKKFTTEVDPENGATLADQ